MTVPEPPVKAAISVSEMAEMCLISRSRWYELVASGIFPKPTQLPSIKRPVYDRTLQAKCLIIRASGIGMNGVPVVWNRKSKKVTQQKQKPPRPAPERSSDPQVETVFNALKGLGLATTLHTVRETIAELYPTGIIGLGQGDVIRKVFLHLQAPRK